MTTVIIGGRTFLLVWLGFVSDVRFLKDVIWFFLYIFMFEFAFFNLLCLFVYWFIYSFIHLFAFLILSFKFEYIYKFINSSFL